MKKHTRKVKVLVSLIVSMTIGAFVLIMLDSQALSEGPFSLAGLYDLTPAADKIAPKTTNHLNWRTIEIYYSKPTTRTPEQIGASTKAKMHFIIANGDCGTDGLISSTQKWKKQQICLSNIKDSGNIIRICIIDNGDGKTPTDCQILRTVELVEALSKKHNIKRKKINYPKNWQI